MNQFSIETGYFIFTMMPSLRCSLNCPHCYLTKDQRRNSDIMSMDSLKKVCENIKNYYLKKGLNKVVIHAYWYGGEPTEMPEIEGRSYVEHSAHLMREIFQPESIFEVKHTVLSSLVTVDMDKWLPIFDRISGGHFQTSFDGLMRGGKYVKRWEDRVKIAIDRGNKVGTISVVNREMLEAGPEVTIDYLGGLGIVEASFLPFMLNEANFGEKYDRYAPSMTAWNDFMIALTERSFDRLDAGLHSPSIGQAHFVMHQANQPGRYANIAAQTLFLLPNGDMALPDYKEGYKEFLRVFGNAIDEDFADVLNSKERRTYLKRQVLLNGNAECNSCPHSDKCVMEFWKDNPQGDDCFGGDRYINWLLQNKGRMKVDSVSLY